MNVRQKTLAALLVLGIGVSGCNNANNSNTIPPTVDKKTDQTTENNRTVVTENNITTTVDKNKTTIVDKNVTITIEGNQTIVKEGNKTTIVDRNLTTESNVTIIVDKNGTKVTDGNDTIIVDKNGTKITDGNDTTVITNPSGENNDTDKKPPVENNNTEENRTATILGNIGSQHSNHNSTITVAQLREITPALSNIIASNLNSYRSYIEDPRANFSTPATIAQVQIMLDTVNTSKSVLGSIGNQHSNGSSDITVAQLQNITPALSNIDDRYLNIYQTYIASADTNISSPATTAELQSMINEVNDFNLPEHAILDRSFFKKTNGAFEHRFVYLPVENTTTGRTWLNNNLGADYANVDSSDYNPSQQATAGNDYLAYGSMFQWGRKADGHELMNWVTDHNGTTKYGKTNTTNDNPSDSLFITKYSDWRVTPDDTLWASESSPNNVCPVGYRLPLNPNGAVDAEHELAVELNSWDSKDADGSMSSVLKLPTAGGLTSSGVITWWTPGYGDYWTGSVVPSDGNNSTVSNARDVYFGNALGLLDTSGRGIGFSVRCIKD